MLLRRRPTGPAAAVRSEHRHQPLCGILTPALPWQTVLPLAERHSPTMTTIELIQKDEHRASTMPELARVAATERC